MYLFEINNDFKKSHDFLNRIVALNMHLIEHIPDSGWKWQSLLASAPKKEA